MGLSAPNGRTNINIKEKKMRNLSQTANSAKPTKTAFIAIALAIVFALLTTFPAPGFAAGVPWDGDKSAGNQQKNAANLDEVLNVEGGGLNFESAGEYPWTVEDCYAISGNKGVHSSVSEISAEVALEAGDVVAFDYALYSEARRDLYGFMVNGEMIIQFNASQSATCYPWQQYVYNVLENGVYTLTWQYIKDVSYSTPVDTAYLDNVYAGNADGLQTTGCYIQAEAQIAAGKFLWVDYAVLPAQASERTVSFVSSNEEIVAINADGMLTGVSPGTATVTVSQSDFIATCNVTVTEATPEVSLTGYVAYDLNPTGTALYTWGTLSDSNPVQIDECVAMSDVPAASAAEFAGDYVYGYDTEGNYFIYNVADSSLNYTGSDSGEIIVYDMAYNHSSQTMYAIGNGVVETEGSSYYRNMLYEVDRATGALTFVADFDTEQEIVTLAISTDGIAYGICGDECAISTAALYSIDLQTGACTYIGDTGLHNALYTTSMAWDHQNNQLFWGVFSAGRGNISNAGLSKHKGLYIIDTDTGAAIGCGKLGSGTSGAQIYSLFIPNDLEVSEPEWPEITITFVDGHTSEVISTASITAGNIVPQELFPEPPEHAPLMFIAWDYSGAVLFQDTIITAYYHDPNQSNYWDFETSAGVNQWAAIDADGDGHNWVWSREFYGINPGIQYDGVAAMISESSSTSGDPLEPDNWLISPIITLPSNAESAEFSFWYRGGDPDYCWEWVGIYITTDGGETWSDEIDCFCSEAEYQQGIVDLSAYLGQSVQVAFRHYDTYDMHILIIDAVNVEIVGGESPEPTPVEGDVNGDGVFNSGDVAALLQYLTHIIDYVNLDLADVNNDGHVNTGDAAYMLNLLLIF